MNLKSCAQSDSNKKSRFFNIISLYAINIFVIIFNIIIIEDLMRIMRLKYN